MIVPMKKLSLLLYHREKEEFLASLRDLGVIHIVEKVEEPSEELVSLNDAVRRAQRVLGTMKRNVSKEAKAPAKMPEAQELMKRVEELDAKHESLSQQIASVGKDIAQLTPWGDVDPRAITRLEQHGIHVRFFELSAKAFEALDKKDLALEVINAEGPRIRFVVIEHGSKAQVAADEVMLPETSLNAAQAEEADLEKELSGTRAELESLAACQDVIKNHIHEQNASVAYETARLSLPEAAQGHVVHLEGWLPAEKEAAVASFLSDFASWYEIREPEEGDNVPVKLRNNSFFKLFEPLTKIFSLPDYYELDPTPFFAPFFALFVGLCLGDLGYGLLLLGLSVLGLLKAPPEFRGMAKLAMVFSLATILAGYMLNTFFGAPIFGTVASSGLARAAFLASTTTSEGGTLYPAMAFAVYLGFIQIILGTVMKSVNGFNQGGIKYSLGPAGSVLLVISVAVILVKADFLDLKKFSAVGVPIGKLIASFPASGLYSLLGIGFLLLVLFNFPARRVGFNLAMIIITLYNFLTGILGDSLSYIRLFALGLAGGLLGFAFNQIAASLVIKDGGPLVYVLTVVGMVVIMVLGHSLNFFLALIGSFVHPLRLTFVEFYKNLDFKGGSIPFRPLTKLQDQ